MVERHTERRRQPRIRKTGANSSQSLFTAQGELSRVEIIDGAWGPNDDYGRPSTDEPLTTDGHPLVATDVYSQTQSTGLRRGAVAMEPRTSARITPALSFTEVVPLEDHITEG